MVPTTRSAIGFQGPIPIQVGPTTSRTRSVCSRHKQATTATATVPPKTDISKARRHLTAYEDFLRGSPAPQADELTSADAQTADIIEDAPIFQTAEGGLVCQWDATIASERRRSILARKALQEYEEFMTTPYAAGVNVSSPVYLTDDGSLVCHYP